MANELFRPYSSAYTVYALARNLADGTVRDVGGAAWETWADGDRDDYIITMTDMGGDLHMGDFPTGVVVSTRVLIEYFEQAGGSPAATDMTLGWVEGEWNGTQLIDVSVSSLLPTTGYQVTLTAQLAGSGTPVVGCEVDVWTTEMGGSGVRYVKGVTDSSGQFQFLAGAATYYVYLFDPAHTVFTVPETIVVTGVSVFTLEGAAFAPGHVVPGAVTVYDWEHLADGRTAIEGAAVAAWPTDKGEYWSAGGIGHREDKARVTTDATGYWELVLVPGKEYDFDLQATRSIVYRRVELPASGSVQLSSLTPTG